METLTKKVVEILETELIRADKIHSDYISELNDEIRRLESICSENNIPYKRPALKRAPKKTYNNMGAK